MKNYYRATQIYSLAIDYLSTASRTESQKGLTTEVQKLYSGARNKFINTLTFGIGEAAVFLAYFHSNGKSVPVDFELAEFFIVLGSKLNDSLSIQLINEVYDSESPINMSIEYQRSHHDYSSYLELAQKYRDIIHVITQKYPVSTEFDVSAQLWAMKLIHDEAGPLFDIHNDYNDYFPNIPVFQPYSLSHPLAPASIEEYEVNTNGQYNEESSAHSCHCYIF
ncbi:unnamed protein product [Blepharisma stoltei]|uniref:Uncharacterized protein n=1 Tax=Blepharisma stoltei TaxID=1481888 RepID=A0AAU9KA55_9CILI|nr:unnamed protein product [Blepharisma stoltei]